VQKQVKVLLAPLDWGLGHATRCLPIIYALLNQNVEVWVAAEGNIKTLLQKELPQVNFLPLAGYKIHYSRTRFWFLPTLLLQLPRISFVIRYENKWLKKIISTHNFNAVISDNRLGLYHKTVPSVYITHQLQIKTGNRLTNWLAQKAHYFFINKFTDCWMPDNALQYSLAGNLSHPKRLPKTPVTYIGPLSRLIKKETLKKYNALVLLSGPEPQRSVLENILLPQLETYPGKIVLVRGLPGSGSAIVVANKNVACHNHLPATDLAVAMQQSEIIICRSGYTTIMDLVALQQKAVVVPTPGQTEQEYLATHLMKEKLFLAMEQKYFSITAALAAANDFSFICNNSDVNQHQKIIEAFIAGLKAG
jgi:uncharacterized protein (TIGR00661 family)